MQLKSQHIGNIMKSRSRKLKEEKWREPEMALELFLSLRDVDFRRISTPVLFSSFPEEGRWGFNNVYYNFHFFI